MNKNEFHFGVPFSESRTFKVIEVRGTFGMFKRQRNVHYLADSLRAVNWP